jgi:hypothetical protein
MRPSTIILTSWAELGKKSSLIIVTKNLKILIYRGDIMVSNTRVTKNKRANKKVKAGSRRKAANRNKGTTPKFEIHQD